MLRDELADVGDEGCVARLVQAVEVVEPRVKAELGARLRAHVAAGGCDDLVQLFLRNHGDAALDLVASTAVVSISVATTAVGQVQVSRVVSSEQLSQAPLKVTTSSIT